MLVLVPIDLKKHTDGRSEYRPGVFRLPLGESSLRNGLCKCVRIRLLTEQAVKRSQDRFMYVCKAIYVIKIISNRQCGS